MKFLACIMSLYILVLIAVPCADHPEDHVLVKNEIVSGTHQDRDHAGDQCSPFCTCDCCVSPILYQDHTLIFQCFTVLLGTYLPEYSVESISFYPGSIWQPPQLS